MISVLTLTYQRDEILNEAIESYLRQDFSDSEMIIINDSPSVTYVFEHPKIKVINHTERFTSIGVKLAYGFSQCKGEFIYRLDDDDLLGPNGLEISKSYIDENPGYDIYHPRNHYSFIHNKFDAIRENVNTGNVYSAKYIKSISFPNKNFGEDVDITYGFDSKLYTGEKPTMIYRWGMETYHVSGMGNIPMEEAYAWTDRITGQHSGVIQLNPNFKNDYYAIITTGNSN